MKIMVRIGAVAFFPDHFHDVVNIFLPVDHLDIARLDDIVSGALIKLAQFCIGSHSCPNCEAKN
jgi:hypothetical protein